ncbi:Signal transduction histidine kinase [Eubacterium ruminantium]|nr:Signal transduction histidine kinase [Eubacterium ruminantium]
MKITIGGYRLRYRHSLRLKIAFIVVSVTIVTLVLGLLISRSILDTYFRKQTKAGLVETYNYCNDLFNEADELNLSIDEIQTRLKKLYNDSGKSPDMLIFIIDKLSYTIFYSVTLDQDMANNIRNIIQTYDFNKISQSKEKYIFRNTKTDENSDSNEFRNEFYELIGVLDDGNVIIIRRPVETIARLFKYVSRLFFLVFVALIMIELIVVVLVATIFSRPIVRMAHIAKRMSNLDFDAKFEVTSDDEIGLLGDSMNELSVKLENTISELKTANSKLQSDIENKMQIDEMRKEFLSHVSHELKTPIALIQGYAEGLKDNIMDDPESRDFYCDVIIDESSKMNNLVMKLLNLNELEFGEDNISIQRFDVTELINEVVKSSNIMIEQSGAKLIFDEKQPVNVWADEFMIEEVITNYLTNAIHYVRPGGDIKIWYEHSEDNKKVRINVYNDGEQIGEEALKKVFIRFYKEDSARTREYGGSGIGLSIVETIMRRHNNNYGVYNSENGVVFYFELDTEAMSDRNK